MSLAEHLEKLRHFHRLADFRSINEASKVIGISQAGLSKSLSNLENIIGHSLFIRTPDGLVLTREGAIVLSTTKTILQEAALLETTLRSTSDMSHPEHLHIGLYDSIAVYFFSALSSYMKTIYKTVDIELLVDSSKNLALAAGKNDIDLAIGVNFKTRIPANCSYRSLFEDHFSFYTAAKNVDDAENLPLIIHPGAESGDGQTVESLIQYTIAKRGAHRVHNFETLKTLTLQNLGVGVLPTQVAKPLVNAKALAQVTLNKTKRLFGSHEIGVLISNKLTKAHPEFSNDIFRLGQQWVEST